MFKLYCRYTTCIRIEIELILEVGGHCEYHVLLVIHFAI